MKFPAVSSHYCRARTNKMYIQGSLNIQTMYRLYSGQCRSNGKECAKLKAYRHILNTETNIGFHIPKKDQYALCEKYKNTQGETKGFKGKFERHQKQKKLCRTEMINDISSNALQVYCYGLQSVFPTPCGDVSSFYYKWKLATFNFTIYDVTIKHGYCFLWHEAIANQGANGICSCVSSLYLTLKRNTFFVIPKIVSGKIKISFYLACIYTGSLERDKNSSCGESSSKHNFL